jgi:hypothetical protein
LHDRESALPLSTFVCRITEAEEIVTVTDKKAVELLVALTRTQRLLARAQLACL